MSDKILIVEDDAVIAELEKSYLSACGYEVDISSEGVSGLEMALANDYSLILLDVMLPGMSGIAICKELRREKNTPVLFVTAKHGEDDIADRRIKVGAQLSFNDRGHQSSPPSVSFRKLSSSVRPPGRIIRMGQPAFARALKIPRRTSLPLSYSTV